MNVNLYHWTAERERLATSSADELKKKAAVWLDWRKAPKAPTRLRHVLRDFVEAKIASYTETEASDVGPVGPPVSMETVPPASIPEVDPQASPDVPLAADGQDGVPAEGQDVVQPVPVTERTVPALEAILARQTEEIAWLRRMLETALRTAQATGVKLVQPAPTSAGTPEPAATRDLVFFGLPLGEGASKQDAS